jgi:hypothetical protein
MFIGKNSITIHATISGSHSINLNILKNESKSQEGINYNVYIGNGEQSPYKINRISLMQYLMRKMLQKRESGLMCKFS